MMEFKCGGVFLLLLLFIHVTFGVSQGTVVVDNSEEEDGNIFFNGILY